MLGLGLASSHAPAMFEPAAMWPRIYQRMPPYMRERQPPEAAAETPEVIEQYLARIDAAFGVLRAQLAAYRPAALLMVGDDQGDMFDPSAMPPLAIFTGDELWGLDGTHYRPLAERQRLTFRCHGPLARFLHARLMKRGFELLGCREFRPVGPRGGGVSHMVAQPVPRLVPDLSVPIVPLFVNAYYPPLPTAARCYALGAALRELLAEWPEPVALYASGGLSHDPEGPRAGWIDEPLDRWILERLERGEGAALQHLFTFDSDTLRGGTGEVRAWIVAAGAFPRPARVVEYIRAHHAKAGLAFAYWPAEP
jgi:hypothetical protein